MLKIYLAIPYNGTEEESFKIVNEIAALCMINDMCVYSPISHNHPIVKEGSLPTGWEYWERVDRQFLEWADQLVIIKKEGWEESTGVQAEIKIAQELNKSISYLDPDDFIF